MTAVEFIARLKHTKGRWAGSPFKLLPWQRDFVTRLFETRRPDGKRQYRTAYVEVPRKNGKTELAAAIALYLLFADKEPGAEIYSAAADRDQAAICFHAAAQMVRQSPGLSKRCKIIDSQKRIVVPTIGSFYRAISADAHTKHGFNAHGVIADELHAWPDRELWDVLATSMGAREQPLMLAITTAGYDRHSICWEQHEYARKVADGIVDDPTFLPVLFAADEEDDWTSEATWRKANPSLGETIGLDFLRQECRKAQEIPAYENTFRRLYLNQWTRQESRYIPMHRWDECDAPVDPDALIGRRCYGGLDLASTTDVAAFVLVFPPEEDGGAYQVLPFFWVPEEGMLERSRRDRVPYDLWVRAGLIEATPGNVIDYGAILATIDRLAIKYDIAEIAFDRWGATRIVQDLEDRGMTVAQFGQGFASMSPPTKELLNLVLAGKLAHGGNPVLRWMADNMVVRQDPAGNVKPDKSKSTEKIDGMVALIMALDRALHYTQHGSVYAERGVLTL